MFSQEVLDRFWSKVNKDGPTMPHMDTPCWVWVAATNTKGYGSYWATAESSCLAHRFSFQATNGFDITGQLILHKCDNPACVNHEHLYVGDHLDNSSDMVARGRLNSRAGSFNANTTLTEQLVLEIRAAARNGVPRRQLRLKYNLPKTTIARIVTYQNWTHVP